MKSFIEIPFLGPNDNVCTITKWHKKNGEYVNKDTTLCTIETTKTNIDIEAEESGFLNIILNEGCLAKGKQAIGKITKHPTEDLSSTDYAIVTTKKIIDKALKLIKKYSLNLDNISSEDPTLIRESDVLRSINQNRTVDLTKLETSFAELIFSPKSLLIIGAGHGNIAAASYFKEFTNYEPTALIPYGNLQINPDHEGLPIFPATYLQKFFDAGCKNIFIHVPYENLEPFVSNIKHIGYTFISFIHPKAVISKNAILGKSVYILEHSSVGPLSRIYDFVYLGPSSTIGSNVTIKQGSMILNAASVAHDSTINEGCLISDGARIAGRVTIEKNTLVGLNSTVNANIKIGGNCIINSGANAYVDLKSNTVLKRDGQEMSKKKL